MKAIHIIFLLLAAGHAVAGDCSFEKNSDDYIPEQAEADVTKYLKSSNSIEFYAVANGFGPSRPGFEKEEVMCVFKKYEWRILWAGGDVVGSCKNREKAEAQAMAYARAFNLALKDQLKHQGRYNCATKS